MVIQAIKQETFNILLQKSLLEPLPMHLQLQQCTDIQEIVEQMFGFSAVHRQNNCNNHK